MKANTLVLTTAAVATLFGMPTTYSSTQNVNNNPQAYYYGSGMKKIGFQDNNSTEIIRNNYDNNNEKDISQDFSELENITSNLFGVMREATKEERDNVNDYFSSLATKKTSEYNFFNIC